MASCSTSRWVSTSPYAKLVVERVNSTGSTQPLNWTLQYISDYPAQAGYRDYSVVIAGETVASGTFNINGKTGTHTVDSGSVTINKATSAKDVAFKVSFEFAVTWSGVYAGTKTASNTISIDAKTKYAIKYNANGGSGAPATGYKWHGTSFKLSSTKPTRSGYTFQGWGTSASDTSVDYAAGASYATNAALNLYAIWKKTISLSYDANGGSGAPSSQSATIYNATTSKAFTISATKPTRANYTFLGWSTSPTATAASYAPSSTITLSANNTLYAVWELSYEKPKITNLRVERCTSSGTPSSSGTYAIVNFDWATFVNATSITIEWKRSSATTWSSANKTTITPIGKIGTVTDKVIGSGGLSLEYGYNIRVTVTDSQSSTPATRTLASDSYLIDFSANGREVAFFATADAEAAENRIRMNSQLYVKDYSSLEGGYGGGYDETSGVTTLNEVGGGKAQFGSGSTGIMKIVLPRDFGNQMISFDVEIFSYTGRTLATYSFAGQISKNSSTGAYTWSNSTYSVKGGLGKDSGLTVLPLNFGRYDGKVAVSIGTASTSWGYCLCVVRNVKVWFDGYISTGYWADGWQIVLSTAALDEQDLTVDKPSGDYVGITITGLPSGSAYTCRYYPSLGLCTLRMYITGKAFSAGTANLVGTVSSHLPSVFHALNAGAFTGYTGSYQARINTEGKIYFITSTAKSASDEMLITGFWMV